MMPFDYVLKLARRKFRQVEEMMRLKVKRKTVVNTISGALEIETRILMPKFNYKTVVVLCAPDLHLEDLVANIVRNNPEKYISPIKDMTRSHPNVEGSDVFSFNLVTHEQMILDIKRDKYVEHGMYVNELYGLRLDSIRSILDPDKIPLLKIQPKTLFALRNGEFAPYVIFIDPPMFRPAFDSEGFMAHIRKQSEEIKRNFAHLINKIIVMNDVIDTIETLEMTIEEALTSPQWIPNSWVSRR